jgi:8-oxo-dGTP pyrophosphatase MutT (NUDIX family)
MEFKEFISRLKKQMTLPLPGLEVQLKMTSNRRQREMMEFRQSDHAVKSSVLILLYPGSQNGRPSFAVILRPTYDGVHSGQISLPGGRFEVTDIDLRRTALRETHEEIGIDPSAVTLIGQLTELYIPPSNYLVQPFVGFMNGTPAFKPQPEEVERIIEIPVTPLLENNNLVLKEIKVGAELFAAPSFVIGDTTIWGATAMILNEFKEILLSAGL